MAIKFNRSQTFATNGTVTASGLHNLVDGLDIYQALITDQTNLATVSTADKILIADMDLTAGDSPRSTTVQNLFEDVLSSGTFADLNLSGNLSAGTTAFSVGTYSGFLSAGTTNATRGTVTTLNSTTGTITNLTAGTTTSTAENVTNGTIQTLTASTGSITVGTVGNLTTTLAGDLTISTGTATVGTRVAVLNTAQQYSRAHNFAATALTITSGTIPWDLSQNQVATLSVTTNSTLNTPTNPQAGATYVLITTQGTGGSNTLSFSTAYKFPGGSAPVLSTGSSQVDVLSFVSNGTVLYGVSSQNFS